jgi:hypothetical protein
MNTASVRYTLAVLTFAGLTALTSMALGAFGRRDAGVLRTALAGKPLVEGDLVPRGFAQVARAKGDLDGDGLDDLALIVRRAEKKVPAKGGSEDEHDVPQAVLIFTADGSGKYTLWKLGTTHFMDSSANLMEEGGVGTFAIKKGVLTIASDVSMSMGGWGAGGCATGSIAMLDVADRRR